MRSEEVWLNNTALRDVDGRIINVKLIEPDATNATTYGDVAGRDGQWLLKFVRQKKPVRVEFAIRELYDLARRTEIIDAVNAWAANGGVLQSSTRPGKRLHVVPVKFATPADVRDYRQTLAVEFEAFPPAWEDEYVETETITDTGELAVHGNTRTFADVNVTPAGTITALTVSIGGNAITLTGISTSGRITFGHDEHGILTIKRGNTSLLNKRTAQSADDLFVDPGRNAISVTATGATVSAAFSVRGRWL